MGICLVKFLEGIRELMLKSIQGLCYGWWIEIYTLGSKIESMALIAIERPIKERQGHVQMVQNKAKIVKKAQFISISDVKQTFFSRKLLGMWMVSTVYTQSHWYVMAQLNCHNGKFSVTVYAPDLYDIFTQKKKKTDLLPF